MESIKLRVAFMALAGASLSLPAVAATPPVNGGTANTMPGPPAAAVALPPNPAQVAPTTPQPAARNGVRRATPVASAASGAVDDGDVQTTIEDGRRVTRNAHAPNAARVGSSPNN
jgi:hypothetical protein